MYAWEKELLKNKITMWFLWAIVIATFVGAAYFSVHENIPQYTLIEKETNSIVNTASSCTMADDKKIGTRSQLHSGWLREKKGRG